MADPLGNNSNRPVDLLTNAAANTRATPEPSTPTTPSSSLNLLLHFTMASAAPVASSTAGAGSVEPDTGYTSFKAISVSEWGDPKVMKVVDNATLAPPSHGQVPQHLHTHTRG